ncbi:serine/threonine-protein kinase [Nocardia sp. A7]|uniref:serine/threonine-protein kinase n=1 Tax=Nocardia sp. A7 TaxID=2789274 RepID=UPI00397A9F26
MTVGTSVAGYQLESVLGRGGMGTVYLARHPRLPRSVALKLLGESMFGDMEARARFAREADLAARLDHPNIVAVYDRGVEDRRPWIAMQYVQGTDAGALGLLETTRAVRIVSEVAAALDFAHGHGVLHRDVKPANILLGVSEPEHTERVMLADFGIARLHLDQNRLTQTGSFTATLAYAAPEQLSGSALDPRCDQYSLACTLFALLTGSVPFAATNPVSVIQAHMSAAPPSISAMRSGLPVGLDAVVWQAMSKEPDNRFASCSEFAAAVTRVFSGSRVSAAAAWATVPASRVQPTLVVPVGGALAPRPSLHRSRLATSDPDPVTMSRADPETANESSRSIRPRRRLLRTAALAGVVLCAAGVIVTYVNSAATSREAESAQSQTVEGKFPGLVGAEGSPLGSGYRDATCAAHEATWPIKTSVRCTSENRMVYVVSEYVDSWNAQASLIQIAGSTKRESHQGCQQSVAVAVSTLRGAPPLHATSFPDDPDMSRYAITVNLGVETEDPVRQVEEFQADWWANAPLCS